MLGNGNYTLKVGKIDNKQKVPFDPKVAKYNFRRYFCPGTFIVEMSKLSEL